MKPRQDTEQSNINDTVEEPVDTNEALLAENTTENKSTESSQDNELQIPGEKNVTNNSSTDTIDQSKINDNNEKSVDTNETLLAKNTTGNKSTESSQNDELKTLSENSAANNSSKDDIILEERKRILAESKHQKELEAAKKSEQIQQIQDEHKKLAEDYNKLKLQFEDLNTKFENMLKINEKLMETNKNLMERVHNLELENKELSENNKAHVQEMSNTQGDMQKLIKQVSEKDVLINQLVLQVKNQADQIKHLENQSITKLEQIQTLTEEKAKITEKYNIAEQKRLSQVNAIKSLNEEIDDHKNTIQQVKSQNSSNQSNSRHNPLNSSQSFSNNTNNKVNINNIADAKNKIFEFLNEYRSKNLRSGIGFLGTHHGGTGISVANTTEDLFTTAFTDEQTHTMSDLLNVVKNIIKNANNDKTLNGNFNQHSLKTYLLAYYAWLESMNNGNLVTSNVKELMQNFANQKPEDIKTAFERTFCEEEPLLLNVNEIQNTFGKNQFM